MSYIIVEFALMLVCFWAFVPGGYAQTNAHKPMEALSTPNFVQALPPIVIDNSRPFYLIEKTPALRPQYLYDSDWTKAIRNGGYLRTVEEDEYFKEANRNIIYGVKFNIKDFEDDEKFLNDKNILRERWREFVGFDLFYPYFQLKKVEKWMKDKFSVRLFGMKGSPKFSKNKLLYVFKTTF